VSEAAGARSGLSRRGVILVSALLALQLALAGAAIGSWLRSRALAPAAPNLPPISFGSGVATPVSLESAFPLALAEAQRWNADSRLLSVEEEVDWPSQPPNAAALATPAGGWLTYVFVAPFHRFGLSDTAATLSVLIERNGGAIASTTAAGWERAPAPLAVSLVGNKIPSRNALAAAEAAAGLAFRRACPASRHTTRIALAPGADGAPLWTITYVQDNDNGNNALTIRINAQTGALAPIANRAPACSGTSTS